MKIGIMQGRLSPPQGESIQFFPKRWQDEFGVARVLQFKAIEWIFDEPVSENPLYNREQHRDILECIMRTRVEVNSVCADIFMKKKLTDRNPESLWLLQSLLRLSDEIRIPIVSIPFVEDHIPQTDEELETAAENVIFALAEVPGAVDLTVEMDLPVEKIIAFVEAVGSPRVGVCYDTGNAMTQGFDAGSDIRKLGHHLKHLHIKDRERGKRESVPLGRGSVDFEDVFEALDQISFDGVTTLQAWRGENYLSSARQQLLFVRGLTPTLRERTV